MTSSLRRTSSSERRFSLFDIGIQKMLAVMTPQSVAVKALAMAGPSVAGEDRSPSTRTRPMTVPSIPIGRCEAAHVLEELDADAVAGAHADDLGVEDAADPLGVRGGGDELHTGANERVDLRLRQPVLEGQEPHRPGLLGGGQQVLVEVTGMPGDLVLDGGAKRSADRLEVVLVDACHRDAERAAEARGSSKGC